MAVWSDEVLACAEAGPSSAADASTATRPDRQRERQRDDRITHGHYAKGVPRREVDGRGRGVRPMLFLFSTFRPQPRRPEAPRVPPGPDRSPATGGQILA